MKIGDVRLQINALANSIIALVYLGEFSHAEEICERIEKLLEKIASPELKTYQNKVHSELAIFKGDLNRACELVDIVNNQINKYGLVYLMPPALYSEFLLKMCMEEFAEAEETGERLLGIASSIDHLYARGLTLLMLGRTLCYKGDFQKAKAYCNQGIEIYSSDETRSELHINWGKLILGLIYFHLQEHKKAELLLQEAVGYFSEISSYTFLMECNFVLALLKQGQRDGKTAKKHLQAGFSIAKNKGYYHCMVIGRRGLAKACFVTIELQVEEAMDYAAHLLSTRLASVAGPELERLSHHSTAKTRKKAREIRMAIHRSKVPRLYIETLGGFRVLRGDSPISEKEWQGKKPRAILKAIVSSDSKSVLNEIIMEDVWPDAPFDKVVKNYKVALHRLRKALEPGIDKALGSSYIFMKDDALYLDEDLCEVDAHKFLSLIQDGKAKEKEGDIKGALKHYNEAALLYKGDFLPEDLYDSWIEPRREELRNSYVALLIRIATLHENKGAMNKAISFYKEAVGINPLLEDAYQRLMALYSNIGKRNEALKVYEMCRKALHNELDVEPDQITVALYKKILG